MTDFPTGCLGKLPLHGDFIRFNAALAEVRELDEWVQQGIYQGYQELDSRWDTSFDAAPVSRFIYCSPRSKRILAGHFKPSVDKAGRRYPFMVYAVIEPAALGNDAGALPWAMEPFLMKAAEISGWSDSAIDLSNFLRNFESFRLSLDVAEARKSFAKYVLSHRAGEFWTTSLGNAEDPRRFAAVQHLAWGAGVRPPESVALRLPVSEPQAETAFWLDLARRFNAGGTLPTLAFWNQPGGEQPVRLHLCFGALGAVNFLPFVLPGRVSSNLKDIAGLQQVDASLMDRARAQFDEVLRDPSLKLSDLLQRLPRSKGV